MKYYLLFLLLFFLGCGGSSISNDKNNETFDLNVEPIVSGIWYKPDKNITWQWQLQGKINSSYEVDLYDVDLFDTSVETINRLHQDGKKVICYFSAGSFERWREDAASFPSELLGKKMDDWDEFWLDISNEKIAPIMQARLDLAKEKGCDGVEPDNVDGYTNDTGFDLSYEEQLAYNKFLANEAHKRGLSVGLKNDIEQVKELEPFFDFVLSEQCFEYNECEEYLIFIKNNKPVLNAEYNQKYIDDKNQRETLCISSNQLNIHTLILPLDLDDSFRYSCD